MVGLKKFVIGVMAVCVAMTPLALLRGSSQNPPPVGKTGAPGDGTCAECHRGAADNPGRVLLTLAGFAYMPGVTQKVGVTILTERRASLTGFQVTARLASNERLQAGHFEAGVNSFVQMKDGSEYVSNSMSGSTQNILDTVNSAYYEFQWTPPANNEGGVKFFVSADRKSVV